MRMKVKQVVALLLALVLVLSLAAGCGKNPNKDVVANAQVDGYIIAEKVGTINRDNFTVVAGGLYYQDRETKKYGVMSKEGLRDTGAIFVDCNTNAKFFEVSLIGVKSILDMTGLNSYGLMDGNGKMIIPMGYADFTILSDRYIKAMKATQLVGEGADYLLSYYDGEDTNNYEGVWFVYDIIKGEIVPGVTGTSKEYVSASGDILIYEDREENRHVINHKGVALPENARVFENGTYGVEGKVGDVLTADGERLFSYDLTGFMPTSSYGEYYAAQKYLDGKTVYAVMDKTGKIVSAEFDKYFTIYGQLIHCGEKLYDFSGKNVVDGQYTSLWIDKVFGNNYMLHRDGDYTIINKDGAIVYTTNGTKNVDVFSTDFVAYQEKNDKRYYYCHKDQDYTLEGYAFAPWLIKRPNANNRYDLVDTMTGKVLLEGYEGYSYTARDAFAYYVYAEYEGGAEAYLIVSNKQFEEVYVKKNALFDELVAAFNKEGIKVSVDKETGEIALDSSVLFGGDSAELSAAGKTFLNKFIKVYTEIAFSEKYKGFITKTLVEGHIAPVQGSTYAGGLHLSEDRANNVRDYCLSKDTGVDVSVLANTLEAVGYSNSKPVYDKNGQVNMAASRRVSFRFLVAVSF